MLYDAELGNAVVRFDAAIAGGIDRHLPLILIAAVAFIHYAHGIGHENAVIAEGGAAGENMGFVPLGQHHSNAQGDVAGFTGFQLHRFGGAQVDPVAFAINVAELFDFIAEIADADFGHKGLLKK